MAGDEMVNDMSNGKSVGVNGDAVEHQAVRRKTQRSVARASRGVIDLGKSGGTSPPKEKRASSGAAKCRIRVVTVTCSEASDVVSRLERICALLIGKVGSDV